MIRRRLRGPERRALVTEAALRLLGERGYDGVSMGDIAKAAGVSRPVLYDHFPSKRELILSLFHAESEVLLPKLSSAVRQAGTPGERARRAVDTYFTFVAEHPVVSRLLTLDSSFDPEVAAAGRQMRTFVEAGIASLLKADSGRQRGTPGTRHTEIKAAVLVAGVTRIYEWWLDHPEVARAEIVEYTMDTIWPGGGQTREPRRS